MTCCFSDCWAIRVLRRAPSSPPPAAHGSAREADARRKCTPGRGGHEERDDQECDSLKQPRDGEPLFRPLQISPVFGSLTGCSPTA